MRDREFRIAIIAGVCLFVAPVHAGMFTGSTSGVFDNPLPACIAPIVCAGLGTASVSWGEPVTGSSSVTFTGVSFDVNAGVPLTVGRVTLENREILTGTFPDSFDLTITAVIANLGINVSRKVNMPQVSTPNLGVDPRADADWIAFVPDIAKNSFFVLEDSSDTVELIAQFLPGPIR